MFRLAIDPGSKNAGVAVFDRYARLEHAQRISIKAGSGPIAIARVFETELAAYLYKGAISEVVVEQPKEYPRHAASVDRLVVLAQASGALAHAAGVPVVRWITAHDWKGGIPKPKAASGLYLVETRIRAILNEGELERCERHDPRTRTGEDMWDAVGVGLVAFGRCRRGLGRVEIRL